jgi:glycosyltransferase involved in cell wall biosynthesis
VRILIANDGFADGGGVQSYLDAVVSGLGSRGHDISMLYLDEASSGASSPVVEGLTWFSISRDGAVKAIEALRAWRPDVCFSHNMRDLDVDHRLLSVAPVIKFMHGYFGTCISGQKMFGLPVAQPCSRTFGAPCLALYFPRRCGQLNAATMVRDYRWATDQRDLFNRYRAILVASEHMRREYVRNGADEQRVHVNPLFSHRQEGSFENVNGRAHSVVFIGRMTTLKGGDLLVRAVADASSRLSSPIDLVMVGDGPQRAAWERLASRLHVRATFVGWRTGEERWEWLHGASLLAVPSVWPEPFGLVGLEAAALGVPAIAFDVGGISAWLAPGENGHLVPANPPRASALADGLVTLFRHPEELCAMRVKASAVARRMSLDRHLERLEAILCGHTEGQPADSARR